MGYFTLIMFQIFNFRPGDSEKICNDRQTDRHESDPKRKNPKKEFTCKCNQFYFNILEKNVVISLRIATYLKFCVYNIPLSEC